MDTIFHTNTAYQNLIQNIMCYGSGNWENCHKKTRKDYHTRVESFKRLTKKWSCFKNWNGIQPHIWADIFKTYCCRVDPDYNIQCNIHHKCIVPAYSKFVNKMTDKPKPTTDRINIPILSHLCHLKNFWDIQFFSKLDLQKFAVYQSCQDETYLIQFYLTCTKNLHLLI